MQILCRTFCRIQLYMSVLEETNFIKMSLFSISKNLRLLVRKYICFSFLSNLYYNLHFLLSLVYANIFVLVYVRIQTCAIQNNNNYSSLLQSSLGYIAMCYFIRNIYLYWLAKQNLVHTRVSTGALWYFLNKAKIRHT